MFHYKKWLEKNYSWIVLNFPAFFTLMALIYKPNLWEFLTPYTGYAALSLLVLVLSLNPLQAFFPPSVFIKKINKHRRQIGVAVFNYAVIHFFCFFIKRQYSVSETLYYFLHPAILPAAIALLIFGILALTSNNYFVKKMGFIQWKKLHKTVYVAEGLIFMHMILLGNLLYALIAFVPLVGLQFIRKRKRGR
ncbi:MAG: ferric reductase-like transmembrane domain-containing protein [Alphaproteobacteria bacterium]|jgi:methionine sulfoxide reductase heme-binding subunit|nr:ferric reductase-like transmembrane domain-containing protein [Alphaproteobacteria bacterium]MBP7729214.1 ferric reductase-like transmembrane domain-containing protein [Alphaproteobacteria bacterium]MDP3444222.1 ferric reductase-like transmembrane domain-containing protein [Ignavibacteria bacterium]